MLGHLYNGANTSMGMCAYSLARIVGTGMGKNLCDEDEFKQHFEMR